MAERLREYRGRLRAAHRRGAAGGETAREMTRFWDGALATLFETASAGRDGFALFAAGSLGREMMSPYSDVDFFLVARDDIPDAVLESVAETMLYPLWDAKVRTGQRIHRAGVLADLARTDAELLTALLDARFIAGDALVRAGVEHRVGELIEYGRRHIEIPRPAPDVADAEYPPTAHVLEPDVKLSPGGLRDYMFAMWNAALALGRDDLPAHLVREHLATRVGLVELAQAVEFLMRVRHELHFSAHAPQDRLRAAAQPEVALALGFAGAGEAEAAKSLLRDYFAAADRIHAF
ncbi:DUF294 nucleotidyltransferase-like domain-containing protein, partial [bacterium]|nr:DUF294 nucleotidyltransferase-like domain-containing protein [bacterium]